MAMTKKLLWTIGFVVLPVAAHGQSFGQGMARVDESIFITRDSVPHKPVLPAQQKLMIIDSIPCGDSVAPKAHPATVRRRPRPRVARAAGPVVKPVPKVVKKPRIAAARPRVRTVTRATRPVTAPRMTRTARMCARVRTAGPPETTLLTDTSIVPLWTEALAPPPVSLAPPTTIPNVGGPSVIPIPGGGGPSFVPGIAVVPFFFLPFIHHGHHDNPNVPVAPPIFPPPPVFPPPSTVPEPGTLTLMATGLVGLVGVVRRRRKGDE